MYDTQDVDAQEDIESPKSTVYALCDPRVKRIRYIGVTRDIHKRYAAHLKGTADNPLKDTWLEDLKAAGLIPALVILESNIDEDVRYIREEHWIRHYRQLGMPLVNIAPMHDPEERQPLPSSSNKIRLKVREIAEARQISQRQIILRSGLDIKLVQKIFRDPYANITLETLGKLAKVLRVDASELIESIPKHH